MTGSTKPRGLDHLADGLGEHFAQSIHIGRRGAIRKGHDGPIRRRAPRHLRARDSQATDGLLARGEHEPFHPGGARGIADVVDAEDVGLEDAAGRFKRLLLAGRGFDLMLLTILTYALLDMATGNTYIAIFAAYAVDLLIGLLRRELATRNIANKTLLDDRFLL